MQRTAVLSSFHYHHARLIEILYCIERLEQLLNDPEILSKHVRALARPNALERHLLQHAQELRLYL